MRAPEATPPEAKPSRPLAGGAMVLASAVCFATIPTLSKVAYDHGADTIGLLSVRLLIGSLILIAIAAVTTGRPRPSAAHARIALLALLFAFQSFAFFKSLALTSTAISVLLLYTYPLIVTLASTALLGERLTIGKAAVLALGFVGVALTVGGVEGSVDAGGVALALSSGVLFAAFLLATKRLLADTLPPLELIGFMYLFASLGYLALAAVAGADLPVDSAGWLATAGIVTIGTVVSMGLFVLGLDHLPAGVTSMLSTLEPAVAVGLAAIFLGEVVSASQGLGVALVLVSLMLLGGLLARTPRPAAHAP